MMKKIAILLIVFAAGCCDCTLTENRLLRLESQAETLKLESAIFLEGVEINSEAIELNADRIRQVNENTQRLITIIQSK